VQDYALWDVIENGNSFKPVPQTTANADGTSTSTIPGPVITKEKAQRKNDVKARSMLLMALPNEHLLTFSQYKDMYGNFNAHSTESLDSIFNSTNKVDTASIQVSVVSTPISTVSSSDNTANLSDATVYAFFANQPNGSQLVHEDLEQIHEDDLEEMDLKWQLALLSMRARRYFWKTGKKITINRSDTARTRNQDSSRKTVIVEDTSSKAMVAIDIHQTIRHHVPPPPSKIITTSTTSPPTVDPPKPRHHHIHSITTFIYITSPPSPPPQQPLRATISTPSSPRGFRFQRKGAFDICINPRRVAIGFLSQKKGLAAFGAFGYGFNTPEAALDLMAALRCEKGALGFVYNARVRLISVSTQEGLRLVFFLRKSGLAAFGAFRSGFNTIEAALDLMAALGCGFDWSYMADDEIPTNMALMALSDSEHEDHTRLQDLLERVLGMVNGLKLIESDSSDVGDVGEMESLRCSGFL
nr:ribonuclease H-like domain-containing protein [Tanacetum cinerariifolium]